MLLEALSGIWDSLSLCVPVYTYQHMDLLSVFMYNMHVYVCVLPDVYRAMYVLYIPKYSNVWTGTFDCHPPADDIVLFLTDRLLSS